VPVIHRHEDLTRLLHALRLHHTAAEVDALALRAAKEGVSHAAFLYSSSLACTQGAGEPGVREQTIPADLVEQLGLGSRKVNGGRGNRQRTHLAQNLLEGQPGGEHLVERLGERPCVARTIRERFMRLTPRYAAACISGRNSSRMGALL